MMEEEGREGADRKEGTGGGEGGRESHGGTLTSVRKTRLGEQTCVLTTWADRGVRSMAPVTVA